MNGIEENIAYAVHLRAEHRRVNEIVRQIERDWLMPGEQSLSDNAASQLTQTLVQLRRELGGHFREEEEGGFLDEAVSRCPNLGHEADQIEQEHAPLLAELDALISSLKSEHPRRRSSAELHRRLEGFSQNLRAHEEAENRVLETAFGTELE